MLDHEAASAPSPAELTTKNMMRTARAHISEGRVDEGIEVLKAAVDAHPYNPFLLNYTSHVLRKRGAEGDLARAIGYMERSLALDPGDIKTVSSLASAYTSARAPDRAEEVLERAYARGVFDIGSLNVLASLYQKRGAFLKAEPLLVEALAIDPDHSLSLALLGRSYGRQQSREAEGVAMLSKALRLNPSDMKARLALTRVHKNHRRLQDASDVIEEGLDRGFGTVDEIGAARTLLAHISMGLGRLGKARELLEALPEEQRRLPINMNLAATLDKREGAARGKVKALRQSSASEEETRFKTTAELFSRALKKGDRKRAEALLQPPSARSPRFVPLFSSLAQSYTLAGSFSDAARVLTAALQAGPPSIALLDRLGQTYLRLGRYDDAIPFFKRALAADPARDDALFGLATALQATHRSIDAEKLLMMMPRESSHFTNALCFLGNIYLGQGRFGALDPLLDTAAALNIRTFHFLQLRAKSHFVRGRDASAREAAHSAYLLGADPFSAALYLAAGRTDAPFEKKLSRTDRHDIAAIRRMVAAMRSDRSAVHAFDPWYMARITRVVDCGPRPLSSPGSSRSQAAVLRF